MLALFVIEPNFQYLLFEVVSILEGRRRNKAPLLRQGEFEVESMFSFFNFEDNMRVCFETQIFINADPFSLPRSLGLLSAILIEPHIIKSPRNDSHNRSDVGVRVVLTIDIPQCPFLPD